MTEAGMVRGRGEKQYNKKWQNMIKSGEKGGRLNCS